LKLVPGIGNITAGKIWHLIQQAESPLGRISEASGLVPKKAMEGFNLFVTILGELGGEKYHGAPSEAIGYILRHGYEEHLYNNYPNAEMRIEDIEQMIRFALRYDSLEMFLADMTLQGVSDAEAEGADEEPAAGSSFPRCIRQRALNGMWCF
jgi:DNA helicase-2/ATP-dependent DNA helicase PcrA